METYVHKQDNSNYLNDNMLHSRLCLAARPERQGVMYSSRVYRMVEEWTTCMRLLSWRRHQGTMLKNCISILPVSDPAKQAAQVVKHVFDERTVIT
jgi:hypothetical protein